QFARRSDWCLPRAEIPKAAIERYAVPDSFYVPFAKQPIRDKNRHERDNNADHKQSISGCIVAQLHRLVDAQRESRGLAGNIACDHDSGGKFTDCASKGEEGASEHGARREREGDRKEDAPFSCAERSGHLFIASVDFLKSHPCRTNEEGE